MPRISLIATLLSVITASSATATFTLNIQMGWEMPGLVGGEKIALVVDTTGDGFAGISSTTGDLLGRDLLAGEFFGVDDLVLDVFDSQDLGGGLFGINSDASYALGGGVDENDRIGVYWFDPVPSDPIAAGQTGGFYRTDATDPNNGGDWSFFIPADNTNKNIFEFSDTVNGSSSVPNSAFTANDFVVIPEPGSAGLAGFSILLLLRRRR